MAQEKRRFLVSETGRKTGIVLSMRQYRELMEDLEDLALIAERKDEPSEPLEAVKKRLLKKWQRAYPVSARGV